MKIVNIKKMQRYFNKSFPDSVAFGNSTGAGISIRSGPNKIDSEVAILKYVPEKEHFTLTLTNRLVKNPSTNTRENFEHIEEIAKEVERECSVSIVFLSPYDKPRA